MANMLQLQVLKWPQAIQKWMMPIVNLSSKDWKPNASGHSTCTKSKVSELQGHCCYWTTGTSLTTNLVKQVHNYQSTIVLLVFIFAILMKIIFKSMITFPSILNMNNNICLTFPSLPIKDSEWKCYFILENSFGQNKKNRNILISIEIFDKYPKQNPAI